MLVFTRSKMFVALMLSLASLPVLAAPTLVASNTNASINTQNHISTITVDVDPNTIAGFDFEMTYDTAFLTATTADITAPTGVTCVINVAGTVTCFGTDPTDTFNDDLSITIAFDVGPNETAGTPLTFTSSNFSDVNAVGVPTNPAPTNGSVVVQLGPPDPLTLSVPASIPAFPQGTIGTTSAPQQLTVTATGNSGSASLANCTAPAGITVNPTSLTFNAAGSQSMDVTCTYAAAAINGNIACTETDDNSAGTTTNIAVSCPAGVPDPVQPTIVTTSPAPNSNTALPGGAVGQTVTATDIINFTNVGGAGGLSSTITCNAAGAVTIVPSGLQTVTGSAAPDDISVSCLLTDVEQAGSVTCVIDDLATDRTETFNFTCPVGSTVVAPSQPETIPSTTLWAKIGLIGLLAALGALVVGFRRHS